MDSLIEFVEGKQQKPEVVSTQAKGIMQAFDLMDEMIIKRDSAY